MLGRLLKPLVAPVVVLGVVFGLWMAPASAATVALTLEATVGPEGTTILVGAPGCQPTLPGQFDIFVQAVSPIGEIGEGAVGAGIFDAPGAGSVLIPAGTPVSSFLLTVTCNDGTLTGSQRFQLAAPAPTRAPTPLLIPARFTG